MSRTRLERMEQRRLDRLDEQARQARLAKVGNAYQFAHRQLNKNASSLKVSDNAVGQAMDDGVTNNVNCANFVSGCLQAANQIPASKHNNTAAGLRDALAASGKFKAVTLANAKPGDVVHMETGSGTGHIVLFAGWKDGKKGGTPLFIGSNNVNDDGSQKVTISSMSYPITQILHYAGPGQVPIAAGATASAGSASTHGGGSTSTSGMQVPSALGEGPFSQFQDSTGMQYIKMMEAMSLRRLAAIAMQSGVSRAELIDKNPQLKGMKNSDMIPAGTKLNLPADMFSDLPSAQLASMDLGGANSAAAPVSADLNISAIAGTSTVPSVSGAAMVQASGSGIAA